MQRKKKKEKKKKEIKTLKYFGQLEERLSKLENVPQTHHDCQKPVETNILPTQTNTEVSGDFNTVQKTELNSTEASTESQSEIIPEASSELSNVSIDTVQLSHVTGTSSPKQKTKFFEETEEQVEDAEQNEKQ